MRKNAPAQKVSSTSFKTIDFQRPGVSKDEIS